MDAIEPILSHPSVLPEVRAAQRSEPLHRDGHRRDGGQGEQRRRHEEEAVEVDVEGLDASEESDDAPSIVLQAPAPRLIDVTADGDPEPPPARRIDVTDDDEAEVPPSRIDLSA